MVDREGFGLALMNLYVLWPWKEFEKSGPMFLALLWDYMNSSGRRAATTERHSTPKVPEALFAPTPIKPSPVPVPRHLPDLGCFKQTR